MAEIELEYQVDAPAERVFDLARSVDLHVRSAGASQEHTVAGVTVGLLALGDEVTWRAKHFLVWQELTSRITAFNRPTHFQDTMVEGPYASLVHDHYFSQDGGVTLAKDRFAYTPPLGLLGRVADTLFLEAYMRRFLISRNEVIKRVAESEEWNRA